MAAKKAKKVAKKKAPKKKKKAAAVLEFADIELGEDPEDQSPYGFALSLGERLGTISQLEKLEESAIHPLLQKAGLSLRLHGSKVSLVEGGEALTPEELCSLSAWLHEEASKAAEEYAIDLG